MNTARIIYLTVDQRNDPKRVAEVAKQVRYCEARKNLPGRNGR